MVNYKNVFKNHTSFNGLARSIPAGATIKILSFPYNLIGTPESLQTAAADYVVTAGKTFTAQGAIIAKATSTSALTFHEGDTADAQTTLKLTIQIHAGVVESVSYAVDFTIAAGKYITFDADATNRVYNVILIGYET